MNILGEYIERIKSLLVLAAIIATIYGCTSDSCFQGETSPILVCGNDMGLYYPHLNSISNLKTISPEYSFDPKCKGPGSTVLGIHWDAFSRPVYMLNLEDSKYDFIPILDSPQPDCQGIDYNGPSGTFLYKGKYKGNRGIFLFDSVFSLIKEIENKCPCEIQGPSEVMFLDDNNIVCRCDEDTYTINVSTAECSFLSVGRPQCISKNREYLLVQEVKVDDRVSTDGMKRGGHSELIGYKIVSITDENSIKVPVDSHIFSASFSPDNKKLALVLRRWSWLKGDDVFYLHIFDMVNGRLFETSVSSKSPFGIFWLD